MKAKITLLVALLAGAAAAQTTIGNVTITRPSDVRNVTPARTPATTPPARTAPAHTAPVRPASAPAAPARTPVTGAPKATAITAPSDLPSGWRHLQGRVVAPSDVRLPAGSRVQVSIEELAPNLAHRSTYLKVSFAATRLSTPYSLQYSAHRLNPQSIYAVRAKVFDREGRLLYANKTLHRAPNLRAAKMNIGVSR
ncbi:MAG: YbaY family lipoprotein [Deinococcus sp.]|nr:YbaY family lipoprotein [Deinococcus sp.]